MADRCEKCGRLLADRKDRFCPRHARQVLRHLESVGYLDPLTISTVDSPNQKLSSRRFLTLTQDDGPMRKTSASPAGSAASSPKSPPPSIKTRTATR